MKLKVFITIILFIISLLYLKKAIVFTRDNDKLMQEIKEKAIVYNKEAIDAFETSHTIIPGIKGRKVNYEKSYQKMKAINTFQESLLVFDFINPNSSYIYKYDKIILSGNPQKKQISIIIKTNYNDNLNIPFDYLEFTNNLPYCLTTNLTINNNCINKHLYTILVYPIKNNFLINIKKIIKPGIILFLEINKNNYNELPLVIKYLKNNNYEIVLIHDLLKE